MVEGSERSERDPTEANEAGLEGVFACGEKYSSALDLDACSTDCVWG